MVRQGCIVKKVLKWMWDGFVYGGHLLSLGAVSVVLTSAILLDIRITWDCLVVVYLGAQIIYLYNRYQEFGKDLLTNPERTKHLSRYVRKIPLIVSCFVVVFVGILLHFNKIQSLVFGLFLLVIGLFYSIFLKKLTKRIIGFKSFFTSLIWALLVIFLAIYYSFSLNLSVFLILIFVYLRELVGVNFSDIKDIKSDIKEELLTLAVVLGEKKLINILNLINILASLPIIIGVYFSLLPIYSLMLLLTIPYSFYYFKKLGDKIVNKSSLYNLLVDSEDIWWSGFILVGKILL